MWNLFNEIGGAVDGIDDPGGRISQLFRYIIILGRILLANELMLRIFGQDLAHQKLLDFVVIVGDHIIECTLNVHVLLRSIVALDQYIASLFR